jgi:hypothetical protein
MSDLCLDPLCRHQLAPLPFPPPGASPTPPPALARGGDAAAAPRPATASAHASAPKAPAAPTLRAGEVGTFQTMEALRNTLATLPRGSVEGQVRYPTFTSADAPRMRSAQLAFLVGRGAVAGRAPLPPETRVLLLHRSGWERALAACADAAAAQGSVSPKRLHTPTGIDHVDSGAATVRAGAWGLTQTQASLNGVVRHALNKSSLAVFHWRDGEGAHVRAFRYANYIVGYEETGAVTGKMVTRWEWREMSRVDARQVLGLDQTRTGLGQ